MDEDREVWGQLAVGPRSTAGMCEGERGRHGPQKDIHPSIYSQEIKYKINTFSQKCMENNDMTVFQSFFLYFSCNFNIPFPQKKLRNSTGKEGKEGRFKIMSEIKY